MNLELQKEDLIRMVLSSGLRSYRLKHLVLWILPAPQFTFVGQETLSHSWKLEILIYSEQCRLLLSITSRTPPERKLGLFRVGYL